MGLRAPIKLQDKNAITEKTSCVARYADVLSRRPLVHEKASTL